MQDAKLDIEEVRFLIKLTSCWFKDYKELLKKIDEGQYNKGFIFATSEELKMIHDKIKEGFTEKFEKDVTIAENINKKLNNFIDLIA